MTGSAEAMNAREAQVYDRQIRLWGVEAQKRLRSSHVLISRMNGVNAEVCKNLVLAGFSVTIHDDKVAKAEHLATQFFLKESAVGKNRAEMSFPHVQELNPLVQVHYETKPLAALGADFLKKFNVVCLSDYSEKEQVRLNKLCRELNIRFFCFDTFGMHGLLFIDLIQHEFRRQPESNGPQKPIEKAGFVSLEDALSLSWGSLKRPGRRGQHVSRVLIAAHALHRFKSSRGRLPGSASDPDAQEYEETVREVLRENDIPESHVDQSFIRDVARSCTAEIAPVCAIMGGIIGQEVVKAISGRDEPINNFFFFDGVEGSGTVKKIAP